MRVRYHVLANDGSLMSVIQKFTEKGDQVRVITVDTPPGGYLQSYLSGQVVSCPQWSLMGKILPNMVILAISMKHTNNAALLYGQNFGSTMQPQVGNILVSMKGLYDAGSYTQALTTGLTKAYYTAYPPYNWDWLWILLIVFCCVIVFGFFGHNGTPGSGFYGGYYRGRGSSVSVGGGAGGGVASI